MSSLDVIRQKINELYQTHTEIHISVSMARPKVSIQNDIAIIKGVYPHIFQVEECSSDTPKCHTIQYTDILTNNIRINELGEM